MHVPIIVSFSKKEVKSSKMKDQINNIMFHPWSSGHYSDQYERTEDHLGQRCRSLLLVLVSAKTVDMALKSQATIKKEIVRNLEELGRGVCY